MIHETSNSDETLLNHLDRLETIVSRKDAELAQLRTESEMKDLLIREMQSALGGQEALLRKLLSRIEDLERRLSATRMGL
jgi:chromosome segregation ATPase